MKSLISIVFSALLFLAPTAFAQTGETPPTLPGVATVTAADAKQLIDKGGVALDVRKKAAYVEGHVPGAKSIRSAFNEQAKTVDPSAFGPNKDAVIIIYGHGTDGWSAVDAAKTAAEAGYKNVKWLRGGWSEWSKAGLPTEQ